MTAAEAARLAAAKSTLKRASGQIRAGISQLAAASADAPDTLAVCHVVNDRSARDACQLVQALLAKHGDVDVVILARPR